MHNCLQNYKKNHKYNQNTMFLTQKSVKNITYQSYNAKKMYKYVTKKERLNILNYQHYEFSTLRRIDALNNQKR